jgi:hypothetical protein
MFVCGGGYAADGVNDAEVISPSSIKPAR